MKNLVKKILILFVIVFMFCMMTVTFAATMHEFDLNEIPSKMTVHLGDEVKLPKENEGTWEVISNTKYADIFDAVIGPDDGSKILYTKAAGTAKLRLKTSAQTYTVSIKISGHKYDKTTNECVCGAKKPVSTLKFKSSSFVFEENDVIEMSENCTIKPTNATEQIGWYVDTIDSLSGKSIASIEYGSGRLTLNGIGVGKLLAVDKYSTKQTSAFFAVFDDELLSQYNLCLGEKVKLPVALKDVNWEIASGDNKLEVIDDNEYKGIKAGTAKLEYETEAGKFTTKIKVSNHKFNKTTGLCVCGAKQPPKTMKFTESTFLFNYYDRIIDFTDSKYISVKPTGAIEDFEWDVETIKDWYEGTTEIATINDDGELKLKDWGSGKVYATDPNSKKEIEANFIIFTKEVSETIELHVGERKSLPLAEPNVGWELTKGPNKVKVDSGSVITALATGTAEIVYSSEVGDVKVKVKVVKHKFDKTTGICSCGAEQPPKTMKFAQTSYIVESGEKIDMSSSKYFTINPEGALEDVEWEIETISSWYEDKIVKDVATVKNDGVVIAKGDYGIAKLTAVHEKSGMMASTYIIIPEDELKETITLHPGDEIELPRIENDINWIASSGAKYLAMSTKRDIQRIEALNVGSATLEYKTSVGITVKVKVKVTKDHVYNKTTGLCECGAERPPEVMKFNQSSYIISLESDEIEMSSSKYFTIDSKDALDDMRWKAETISDWYVDRDEDVIIVDKTDGNVRTKRLGIAKLTAYHTSDKSASTYILVSDKEVPETLELHVGDSYVFPRIEKDIYWELQSGDDVVEVNGIKVTALESGTAKFIYETSIGRTITMVIKVTSEHIYDESGYCGCGENKYGLTQGMIDKLAELEIIAEPVDGTFVVDKTVNRGEVASLLIGLLNKRDEAEELQEEQIFTDGYDADKDVYMWWNGYANLALELGLISEFEDGTFRGENNVTNAEFVKLMVVLLGYEPEERENGDHWAAGYMATAEEINLLDGINETLFNWDEDLTRGNAAIILYNALGIEVNGKGKTLEKLVFDETRIEFFVIYDVVFREDSTTYVVPLMNENSDGEYVVVSASKARTWAKDYYKDDSIIGSFVWVRLNEDNEIVDIEIIVDSENDLSKLKKIHYGYGKNEYYAINEYDVASYDDDNTEIVNEDDNDEIIAVRSSTVLIKLIYNASDDTYEVEFSEGLSAFKDIANERVTFVYDANVKSERAKYVIIYEGAREKTELKNQVGRVIRIGNHSDGYKVIGLETEDGEKTDDYKFAGDTAELKTLSNYELIVYNVTSDEFFEFVYGLDKEELNLQTETSSYVSEIETTRCVILDGKKFDLDSKQNQNLYEDYVVVEVNVTESDDDTNQYEIESFETFDYEDIKIKAKNRIIIDEDAEVFIVIKGMDERVENNPPENEEIPEGDDDENTETTLTTMRFNSSSYVMDPYNKLNIAAAKYFEIEPKEELDNVKWEVKKVNEWYWLHSIGVTDGVVSVGYEPGPNGKPTDLFGIAKLTATHDDTNTTASTYLFVFNKEVQDEITIHVNDAIHYLPTLERKYYWNSSNDNIVQVADRNLNALAEGEVTLTYETSVGIPVTMKVNVTKEHEYDNDGHCVCEDTIYEIKQIDSESVSGFTQDVIDVLEKYNIMTKYSDGTFKEKAFMTKADCAKILTATLNKVSEAENLANKKVFSDGYDNTTGDVEWWNGYANFVAELGILRGNPDGTFAGNKTVTNAEFITCVIRMLGYKEVVEAKGTWPTNYLAKAMDLKLLEGATFASYSDTLTRDVAAVILYNALQTEVYGTGKTLVETVFGENIVTESYPTEEMEEKLDAYGIMTASTATYFDKKSTRIQIAKSIINTLKLVDVAGNITSESKFSDITDGTNNARYANLISELEIMEGFDDETFAPDETLTNLEFITCVVKALGYKELKETEYLQKANELGLLEGLAVNWNENDTLTNGFAAVIFYNMLDCKIYFEYNGEYRESKSTIEEMLAYGENGSFGAIVSDGLYKSSGIWYVDLGSWYVDTMLYELESSAVTSEIISQTENYYEDVKSDKIKPFVYYKENDDGLIEKIEFLADGNEYGGYIVEELNGYKIDSEDRLNNKFKSLITSKTEVIEIVEYYNDKKQYTLEYMDMFNFENLKYCTGDALVLYNIACPEYATHIFVINKENEVFTDEVTKTKISASVPYIEVNGEMLEIDSYPSTSEKLIDFVNDLKNSVVIYTRNEDVLSLIDYYKPNMLSPYSAYDEVLAIIDGNKVKLKNNKLATEETIDLTNEETISKYEDAIFVLIDATIDSNGEVTFEDYEVLGKGIANAEFKLNDRIVTHINKEGVNSVAIVRGLKSEDIMIRNDIRKFGKINYVYTNTAHPYLRIDETTFYIANGLGYDDLQSLVGSFVAYDSYWSSYGNYITAIECDFGEYDIEYAGIVSSVENDIVSFVTEGWPDLDLNNTDNIKEYKNATVVEIYITEDADGNAIFDTTKKHEVLGLGLESTNFEKGDRVILGCDVIAILKGLELPEDTNTPAEEPDEGENGNNPEQTPENNESGEESGETIEGGEQSGEEFEGIEEPQRQVCKIILEEYIEGDIHEPGNQILVELESEDEAKVIIGENSKVFSTETELVVCTIEVEDGEEVLYYINGLDLNQLNLEYAGKYVSGIGEDGREAYFQNDNFIGWTNFDEEKVKNIYEGFTIIDVTVEENDEFPEAPYRVKTFGIVDYSEFKLQVADRLFIDTESETMFIVHGMPEK